jgi:hypothetical protein
MTNRLVKTIAAVVLSAAVALPSLITTETHEVTRIDGDYIDSTNTTQDADRRADKPKLYVPTDKLINGSDAQPGDTVQAFYLRLNGEDLYLGGITK